MTNPQDCCAEQPYAKMQALLASSPKQAQALEEQGKFDEARKLYAELAQTVIATEDQPRKIFGPYAVGLLAQYLERRGEKELAMQWYKMVVDMPVSAHAYKVKSENMLRYAALLKKGGSLVTAKKIETEARQLAKTQNRLDASGADY